MRGEQRFEPMLILAIIEAALFFMHMSESRSLRWFVIASRGCPCEYAGCLDKF